MFGFVFLIGCQDKMCREVPAPDYGITIDIERTDVGLFGFGSAEEVVSFLENNRVISDGFFYANEYPNLQILANRIFGVVQDPYVDTLYREAVTAFDENGGKLKADLETGIGNLQYYYPETPVPRIRTMVSGLYNDLFISDSVIIIGIDYFIGEEATFRPNDIPQYILRRYNYDYLAPTILKFVVNSRAATGVENTLLSEMIDFGKVYYFLSLLLPCTPDHEIIGFTATEMEDVKANQEIIWASLIQNEVLYETSEFTKKKFIGERPNVYEIGEKCPGRIGAWVGWEIVKKYAEKTDVPLQELLSETNHHQIFAMSGYKPKNVN